MWGWIGLRLIQHKPLVPFRPRHSVPWRGSLVLLVALFYVFSPVLLSLRLGLKGGAEKGDNVQDQNLTTKDTTSAKKGGAKKDGEVENPIVTLVRNDPSAQALLVVVISAVLVAPLVEEFLFRLLLQGWLERVESKLRRTSRLRRLLCRVPVGLRGMLRGLVPVLAASLLFATLHYRKGGAKIEPPVIEAMLVLNMVVGLFTLAFGLFLLKSYARPTMIDLGFSSEMFWRDVRLGILTFLSLVAPIYLLQGVLQGLLKNVLEWNIAADPFTIALFAFVLGTLYYRTHRIVPSVVLHMCLNATSVALAFLLPGID
ncbi:MAG: type II CAAX prenyl endopeptidase Rce1 family protein [Thermoguttaceae bacterium]